MMILPVLMLFLVSATLGEYHKGMNTYFHPSQSSSFSLVKLGNVNVTFLDETNLLGYDGADYVEVGGYRVKTRFGLIQQCNSANFDSVDGILGFGWANNTRTAALLKTLTTTSRPHWHIEQDAGFVPMPRVFAFTASQEKGELQLGGFDPNSVDGAVTYFPMVGPAYGVNITSITYGVNGPELLRFANADGQPLGRQPTPQEAAQPGAKGTPPPAYIGEFDSGTTCLLLPNTTVNGTFLAAPYQLLYDLEMKGVKQPLIYTIGGVQYSMAYEECVDAADTALILGDAWFRKYLVVHDLLDLENKKMGLGLLKATYVVGAVDSGSSQLLTLATSKLSAGRSILATENHPLNAVRKVPLVSQRHVTYNIQLSLGTPLQPMQVIFDTGSYMLAVFADPPPPGLTPTGLLQVDEHSFSNNINLRESSAGHILLAVNGVLVVVVVLAAFKVQYNRMKRQRNELRADYTYGAIPSNV